MSLTELFIIATGLSMDAFAVAVCKGLSFKKINWKNTAIISLYFGGFQAIMPLLGYLVGFRFQTAISAIDHWIAFFLLGIIGINMIRESLSKDDDLSGDCLNPKHMIVLALATSVDAFAVGITFAFLQVSIVPAVSFIGIITLVLSAVGVYTGAVFGTAFKSKAEFLGGVILILMGSHILLSHLGIFV